MEVRHPVIPLIRARSPQIRPRHKRAVPAYPQLGLKDKGDIRMVFRRSPVVFEEQRNRPRPGGDVFFEVLRQDPAFDDMEQEPAGLRDVEDSRVVCFGEFQEDLLLPGGPLPDCLLVLLVLDLYRFVVPPGDGHLE